MNVTYAEPRVALWLIFMWMRFKSLILISLFTHYTDLLQPPLYRNFFAKFGYLYHGGMSVKKSLCQLTKICISWMFIFDDIKKLCLTIESFPVAAKVYELLKLRIITRNVRSPLYHFMLLMGCIFSCIVKRKYVGNIFKDFIFEI